MSVDTAKGKLCSFTNTHKVCLCMDENTFSQKTGLDTGNIYIYSSYMGEVIELNNHIP